MPVEKDESGCLVVRYGVGDVVTAIGKADGDDVERELMVYPGQPHPIGTPKADDMGKRTDEVGAVVRLRFERAESLVVFIGQAVALLDAMVGNKRA